jgi:capsular polysaccharide transport system ATP-binding protein
MSIDVIGVSHSMKPRRSRRRLEFRDINMHIAAGQRVAILGRRGSGLEELLNVICGAVYPARGTVVRSSEISWPIGETGFLSQDVSLATNLRFVARIYEADQDAYTGRVEDVAGIGEHWNDKLGGCPKDVRARFAFGLGVCLPFDIYLFDSVELRDDDFQPRADAIVDDLAQSAGIIISTTKGQIAQQFCDQGFVLDDGTITYYEDIQAAVAHLERLSDQEAVEADEGPEEREEEDEFDVI